MFDLIAEQMRTLKLTSMNTFTNLKKSHVFIPMTKIVMKL